MTRPATVERMRAFRYALDPTPAQLEQLTRCAGAARWAFNHALAQKVEAHQQWRATVDNQIAEGVDAQQARGLVKIAIPTKATIQKAWNQAKGDSRAGIDGICPWWHEVSTYCFQSAFQDADAAWANWLDSLAGRRAGRPVGYPRFKKRGLVRDSFRIHHDVTRPTIRLAGYRRVLVPRLGEVRIHGTSKPLAKLVVRGQAIIQSVTISRGGHRWYISVLAKITTSPTATTRAQRQAGTVGVDLGVHHLAALSTGELIANPRALKTATTRLMKAQRAISRTQRGSQRRQRAKARLGRRHHEIAARRAGLLHQLTKRLATSWSDIAIEDLNLAGMTRSARGTLERPGHNVRAKAGLNRSLLDASLHELRRQLTYKTSWYGSTLRTADRWAPTSKTCSACGWRNPSLTLAERTFHCQSCHLSLDRDVNAAVNIATAVTDPAAWQTAVASGTRETLNARREDIRPSAPPDGGRQPSPKREDHRRQVRRPPRRSDPPASPPVVLAQVS